MLSPLGPKNKADTPLPVGYVAALACARLEDGEKLWMEVHWPKALKPVTEYIRRHREGL